MTDLLGWLSSFILLVTIVQQIWTQWRERSTKGVSKWLFIGQTAASAGFTVYSWLVGNWVFVVTNSLLLASAIVGCLLTWSFRRGDEEARPEQTPSLEPQSRSTVG